MKLFTSAFLISCLFSLSSWAQAVSYSAQDLATPKEVCQTGAGEYSVEMRVAPFIVGHFTKYERFCRVSPRQTGVGFVYCKSIVADAKGFECTTFTNEIIVLSHDYRKNSDPAFISIKSRASVGLLQVCAEELKRYCSHESDTVEQNYCVLSKVLDKRKPFLSESCAQALR